MAFRLAEGAPRFNRVPQLPRDATSSSTLTNWTDATDWLRANGSVLSFNTNLASGPRYFRVEVKP